MARWVRVWIRRCRSCIHFLGCACSVGLFFVLSIALTNNLSLENDMFIPVAKSKVFRANSAEPEMPPATSKVGEDNPTNASMSPVTRGPSHGLALTSTRVAESPKLRLPRELEADCQKLIRPLETGDTDHFRRVDPEGSTYVFSAHFDDRTQEVKIVAVGAPQGLVWCQLWLRSVSHVVIVAPTFEIMAENHAARMIGIIIRCRLPTPEVPHAVSISLSECAPATHVLHIAEPRSDERSGEKTADWTGAKQQYKSNLTVCVTPMFGPFNETQRLVEMVEIQRMFGADHFVFYNLSVSEQTLAYLRHYSHLGIADVIEWGLPTVNYTTRHTTVLDYIDVYYHAQVAAYHDCLLRNLNKSTYITFLDIDENLVPRKHDNIVDLFEHYTNVSCALIFRNVFFRKELTPDEIMTKDEKVVSYDLRSLLNTKRESKIWPGGDRSKYLARTRALHRPSIHSPGWGCGEGRGRSVVLPPEVALLHHYRALRSIRVRNITLDRTMVKYRDAVVARVAHVHEAVRIPRM